MPNSLTTYLHTFPATCSKVTPQLTVHSFYFLFLLLVIIFQVGPHSFAWGQPGQWFPPPSPLLNSRDYRHESPQFPKHTRPILTPGSLHLLLLCLIFLCLLLIPIQVSAQASPPQCKVALVPILNFCLILTSLSHFISLLIHFLSLPPNFKPHEGHAHYCIP
jgi:hypothetical protein